MRKRNNIMLFSIALILVTMALFSGNTKTPVSALAEDTIIVTCIIVESNCPFLEMVLEIPVIAGLPDRTLQEKINASFQQKAFSFKSSMESSCECLSTEKEASADFLKSTARLSYIVHYNQSGILSISITYLHHPGGVHVMLAQETLNLQIKTGVLLSLKDFFLPGVDIGNTVLEEIRRQIAADPDEYESFHIEELTVSDDQSFYVGDGFVAVYFRQYEIAPFWAGIPEFEIPVSFMPN